MGEKNEKDNRTVELLKRIAKTDRDEGVRHAGTEPLEEIEK